ncbi:uncharacterized protein LOC143147690 isoform X2 [Ptiloglossa arizonensis]|uniref:uncharacterized protein LOC143147690 isoform X2 n=1 Tax=Ptiloglossa arizonensis TaxID=3350558 RepID=UPI003FA17CBC
MKSHGVSPVVRACVCSREHARVCVRVGPCSVRDCECIASVCGCGSDVARRVARRSSRTDKAGKQERYVNRIGQCCYGNTEESCGG